MPKRKASLRACTRKVRWESRQAAEKAAGNLGKKRKRLRVAFAIYYCKFCGGFHLAHKDPPKYENWR